MISIRQFVVANISALALLLFARPVGAANNAMLAAAMESITPVELYDHVEVLADDVYEGRAAGSRGGHAAAQYIVQQLRQTGLEPAGTRGDYFQTFNRNWRNILVLHRGDDPDLEDELIVVGGHYDHVGYGNQDNSYGPTGRIHNGADDNASGVAVLLETIEAFAASGVSTRRPILFAFWDGEERGLVGSTHWLQSPTLPDTNVKLAITVDMVGRMQGGRLYMFGTRSGFGMRRLLSGPLPDSTLDPMDGGGGNPLWLDFTWEVIDNSDHWPFLQKRIPAVLLHTGLHRDYHRPSDDVEKVNRDGMRDVARYLTAISIKAANEEKLPAYRREFRRESTSAQRVMERPLERRSVRNWPVGRPRPRLGISWREDKAEPGSVLVTQVVEGTPAHAAGLAVRDRIYELDASPFADAAEFESAITSLLDSQAPEITLLIERRGNLRPILVRMPSAETETN
ncbi:MAG TPA: M20/M25/M40 family metallo-hydrolase [Lacipirellulaceae bacterium]